MLGKCSYSLIYNHTGKLNKQGKSVIQIRIYQNLGSSQKSKYLSTGIKVKPEFWNDRKKEIRKHPNAVKLNLQIRNKIAELEDFELSIINKGKQFNLRMFADYLNGKYTNSFTDFVETELQEIAVSGAYKKSTVKALNSSFNHIKNFRAEILFSELDFSLIESFDRSLRKKGLHQNTIYVKHKHFKQFITKAVKKGYLEMNKNPYNFFKSKLIETHRSFLTPEQIEKIENFEFSQAYEHLKKIRDYFMFMFYTGLRYSDFENLKKENIKSKNDTDFYIEIKPLKTETTSNSIVYIPLKFNGKPLKLIEKYKKENKQKIFDDFENQYFNRELKKIAVLCEIKKTLTAHVARHSFATYLLLKNIPLNVISKLLGHKSVRTTEIYAKTLNLSIDQNLNNIDYNF